MSASFVTSLDSSPPHHFLKSWSSEAHGLPFPSPADLPDLGTQPMFAALQMDSPLLSHQGSPSGILKVKLLVAQSYPTLCNPMDCNLPGSSLHGILQASILEWVVISFSRGSSWPRGRTQISCIAGRFFTIWETREAPIDYVSHKKE